MTATTVKERPIIFGGEMVRAILDERKTQTRRVVMRQPPEDRPRHCWFDAPIYGWTWDTEPTADWFKVRCPYGRPGDRLWVRETWATSIGTGEQRVMYKAGKEGGYGEPEYGWKSPIFMPRWASRITLEITDVRAERVQDTSIEDVLAEGIKEVRGQHSGEHWREGTGGEFVRLWDSINVKRGFGWESNPWVWAITFKRIAPKI